MEKNLLPIGIPNTRPNFDFSPSSGWTYNQDSIFSNVFFEVYKDAQTETQKVFCIRRPGIAGIATTSFGTNNIGTGCFAAQPYTSTNIFYTKQGTFGVVAPIYHYNGTDSTFITNIVNSPLQRINFTNIGLPDDTYTTAATSGPTLHLFKGRTASTTATPAGASADLTRAIYLNNRVFVGDRVTGQIFQSSLGTYTTYSGSEFISVESYGGKLVELGRYNNFIVAFKEYSIEFFEDVANQNGSVLGRVGQANQQLGTVHTNTVVDTGAGELIWLAMDESGNRSVVKLNNSFNVEPIQDPLVAKYLNLVTNYDGSYAYLLNANGHQFYVLTLKQTYGDASNSTDIANVTFVYDLDTKLWTHWYSWGENTSVTSGSTIYRTLGRWNVVGAVRTASNVTLVQSYDNGNLYQIDDSIFQDTGLPIYCRIRLSGIDLGTNKRKFLNKLTIFSDTVNTTQFFEVSIIRNDSGVTSSYRTTLAYPNSLYALGQVRRFTIEVGTGSSMPMRISAINLEYDIGDGHGLS